MQAQQAQTATLSANAIAILAGVGIYPESAEPLAKDGIRPDRELGLAVSDGFTRQTWRRQGQTWNETRDTLGFDEGEQLRISITNDMPGVRVVTIGESRALRVRAGETATIDMKIDRLATFDIAVVGQPALSRPVKVRAKTKSGAKAA